MFESSHVIKLTMALYKVSDFFPEKEPLKILIRKKADEVLAGLISLLDQGGAVKEKVINDIEIIKAFLELAKAQNWLKKENFEILEKEYNLILEDLAFIESKASNEKSLKPSVAVKASEAKNQLDSFEKIKIERKRCAQIIEVLKKNKEVQVKDLKDVFPSVSKRTLRRDFEYLLSKGIVQRKGDNNSTVYSLK